MINLAHRLAPFQYLSPSDPIYYGFNTTQAAFDPFTPGDAKAVVVYVQNIPTDLKVLLAFTPKPTNALFTRTHDEPWYDTFSMALQELLLALNDRVVGVRFNHEYRPSIFPSTIHWEDWLRRIDYAMWQYIVNYQKAKWLKLLEDTKSLIGPVQFLESSTGTTYDSSSWTDFRKTFLRWIDYQCHQEAVVINRLSNIAGSFNLPFYLYPGGRCSLLSPRLLPDIEYTVNQKLLIDPNIILELPSWSSFSRPWINMVAISSAKPFISTAQLDLRSFLPTDATNPVEEYGWRMESTGLDGKKAQGFGFWTDWLPSNSMVPVEKIQQYLNGLREVLTP